MFVILVTSHFGYDGGALVLITPVPGHFLPFYFYIITVQSYISVQPYIYKFEIKTVHLITKENKQ